MVITYMVYSLCVCVGALLGNAWLNSLGAVLLLVVVAITQQQKPRHDVTVLLALALLVLPFVTIFATDAPLNLNYLFKYLAVFLLYVLIFNAQLLPVQETRYRPYFLILLGLLVAASLFRLPEAEIDERAAGVFTNPNNLALMAFALLLFVKTGDLLLTKRGIHGALLGAIVLSGTSGALIAYGLVMPALFITGMPPRRRRHLLLLVAALLGAACIMFSVVSAASSTKLVARVVQQVQLLRDEGPSAWAGSRIDFYALGKVYGEGSVSALWRLSHWRKAIDVISKSSWPVILLGRGVGSSQDTLGLLPHNDYLRFALETGLIGLALFLSFLWTVGQRLAPMSRCILLTYCIYSFSENNFDNFLFMALLVFFLGSNARWHRTTSRPQFTHI